MIFSMFWYTKLLNNTFEFDRKFAYDKKKTQFTTNNPNKLIFREKKKNKY